MQENDKYKVVSTKVSPESYRLLLLICKRKGINPYEFLQVVIDTLIRYMDDRHCLTPDMEKAMAMFDHMEGWRTVLTFTDPQVQASVHEAIYLLSSETTTGSRAVHVEIPFMGEKIATCNVQDILERFICLSFPQLYKRLRLVGAEEECRNALETIDLIVRDRMKLSDIRELHRTFEDNDRSNFGIKPVDAPYKTHQARGMDNGRDRKFVERDMFNDDAQQEVPTVDELREMEETESREIDE